MSIALKIFISSPGDVDDERRRAKQVIRRLHNEFARFMDVQAILWEEQPQRATEHFQEQIVLPSQTDIVVCILWSRLGTRLPPDKFRHEDGTPYRSAPSLNLRTRRGPIGTRVRRICWCTARPLSQRWH